MNLKKSSEELKGMAREQLMGNYGKSAGVLLTVSIVSTVLAMVVEFLLGNNFLLDSVFNIADVLYFLINFIVSLLLSVFTLGMNYFFLNIARNKERKWEDLFWGFKNHPDKIILLTLLITLIEIACLLPGYLLIAFALISKIWVLAIIGFLFLLVGLIVSMILMLRYCLATLILTDAPFKGVLQVMKESHIRMNGNKGRCFYLLISFAGWFLLLMLTFGLGYLWINPYMSVTFANFYINVLEETPHFEAEV